MSLSLQQVKAIIYQQPGVAADVKHSALWLYQHELEKLQDASVKHTTQRKVLSNVLKWMAGQEAQQKYFKQLTAKELEILQLMVEGVPQKKIALEMRLSPRTIKRHLTQIRRKVKVWSTYQAIAVAVSRGWVKAPRVDD